MVSRPTRSYRREFGELNPEYDAEDTSYSESQSEYYGVNSRTRMPAYDEESRSYTDTSYDDEYTDDESYTDGSDGSFDWDHADAIHEPNIVEAMKKFQNHQALQQIMYTSMSVRRKPGRERIPMFEEETGHVEYVAPLENDPGTDDDNEIDGIHVHPVEVPLGETVAEFVHAVEKDQDVKMFQATALRDKIAPLSQKREELNKLRDQIDAKVNEAPRQKVSKFKADFLRSLANILYFLKPFQSTLKWIDSHYGADVFSYFAFALWIVTINLVTFAVTFVFGMAPTILWHDLNNGKSAGVIAAPGSEFEAEDILTGGGYLSNSLLHYGFYLSDTSVVYGGWKFDRTLGYLFSLGFFYMFQFIVITYSLTHSYGKLMSASLMGGKAKYCDTVFFLWEYSTRAKDTISLNKSYIQTSLRNQLTTVKRIENQKQNLYIKRFYINFGVLAVIVGIFIGIWFMLNNATLNAESGDESIKLAKELAPVIAITAVNLILPFLFSIITKWEKYGNYQTELAMSLAKGVLLEVGTLGVLYFYWLLKETKQELSLGKKNCAAERGVVCWESDLSLKFYQLVMMNLIFECGLTILVAVPVCLLRLIYKKHRWTPVFRADLLTQRIIYLQALTWFATYYSPIMCGLALFTTSLVAFRDFLAVRYTKFYRSAPLGSGAEGTHLVYYITLLLSFLVSTVSVASAITLYLPSNQCGPFKSLCPEPDIIVATVGRFRESATVLYMILDILIMPAVLGFIMLVLLYVHGVFIYYFHVKSQAFEELTPVLQNHLALEGRDQIALFLRIQNQGNGPSRSRRPRRKREGADQRGNGPRRRDQKSTVRRVPVSHQTVTTITSETTARTRV